jgi:hypothetical protein
VFPVPGCFQCQRVLHLLEAPSPNPIKQAR